MTKQIKTWQERLEQTIGDGQITSNDDVRLAMLDYIGDLQAVEAAAINLVKCKGRYHTEQNYKALEISLKGTL